MMGNIKMEIFLHVSICCRVSDVKMSSEDIIDEEKFRGRLDQCQVNNAENTRRTFKWNETRQFQLIYGVRGNSEFMTSWAANINRQELKNRSGKMLRNQWAVRQVWVRAKRNGKRCKCNTKLELENKKKTINQHFFQIHTLSMTSATTTSTVEASSHRKPVNEKEEKQ